MEQLSNLTEERKDWICEYLKMHSEIEVVDDPFYGKLPTIVYLNQEDSQYILSQLNRVKELEQCLKAAQNEIITNHDLTPRTSLIKRMEELLNQKT